MAACRLPFTLVVLLLFSAAAGAQPRYRTFSQDDLALKKAKAGKITGSRVCFTFVNSTDSLANDLHAKFNTHIRSVDDSGGYTLVTLNDKGKGLDLSGFTVSPGESVTICLTVEKKEPDSKAKSWWWTSSGVRIGPRNPPLRAGSYEAVRIEPNGGNALEFLYKHILHRPKGLLVGIKTDTPLVGWIRYKKADRKYFPHTGPARCFDKIVKGEGGERDFVRELKNPHVKKHNNHLLGELHAMKLAVIANDSGMTEPLSPGVTLFGDLLYNDSANSGDACNGKTIREIAYRADSALTYCSHFGAADYTDLDACIARINAAFGGPYVAESFRPLILEGTHTLAETPFLHPNPAAAPSVRRRPTADGPDDEPGRFQLGQNYPNPFNPATTIDFTLAEPALVTVTVYNILGEEIITIVDREEMDEGEQSVDFDGSLLPSGVYFYRITARGQDRAFNAVRRMMLLK